MSRRDLALLFERLETYLSSGLLLHDALTAAAAGMSGKASTALIRARDSVLAGNSLSRSLQKSILLSSAVSGLIEQGEASGGLSEALGLCRMLIEREDALMKTCVSALAYPTIIGVFALILTIGLMRGVMPQIIPLLESLHVELPVLTKVVIYLSRNLVSYGVYMLVATLVIIPVTTFIYRRVGLVRRAIHTSLLHLPIVGRLARYFSISLMLRSLGALIESGTSSADAYTSSASKIGLLPLRTSFVHEASRIGQGISLGTVFLRICPKPPYVSALISAGEASGTLGRSLVRAADMLDRDIEHALKRLTALVEPVMMAGMGCAVGAIALSIMMPIYAVSSALQH